MRLKISPPSHLFSLTHFLIALCSILFIGIHVQEFKLIKEKGSWAAELAPVPLMQQLLFDQPPEMKAVNAFVTTHDLKPYDDKKLPFAYQKELKEIEEIPTWKGVYPLFIGWLEGRSFNLDNVTLFQSIRKGEVWRLFTPTVLHSNFLHILFNMIWLWMLGKQIENRLGKGKLLILTLLIALVTNVMQYLMTGPLFLGYSGVVLGMAGFIWMRQKKAPWEGYPLPRATLFFLFLFVLAIVALELFTFLFRHLLNVTPNIANTAHIVGGLTGIVLAKVPFFARKIA